MYHTRCRLDIHIDPEIVMEKRVHDVGALGEEVIRDVDFYQLNLLL